MRITDYISGIEINGSPEEVDAVQPFAKQLVGDYGYDKSLISTHPQHRVKSSPSDVKRSYPVDIAVFKTNSKKESDLYIVVECKRKEKKEGIGQLKDYMRLSSAEFGVWFNGEERLFLQKHATGDSVTFSEIPNIPKFGQRVEDIGRFKREDLSVPGNLQVIFKSIRNYLAGNFSGVTRDEELARELINIIFCKIYDEKFTRPEDVVEFRAGVNENPDDVKKRINAIFNKVKDKYSAVIDKNDSIKMQSKPLVKVVGELQNYSLMESKRHVISEAFEVFISHALKGGQGQFFTPRNVISLLVKLTDPKNSEKVIDPACGTGGFLVESLRHVWGSLDKQAEDFGWNESALNEEKNTYAVQKVHGIEKDMFLSKVTKAYMALMGDGKGGIFSENTLETPKEWSLDTNRGVNLGGFDVLLGNPPFGSKIKISGKDLLSQYSLAKKNGKLKKDETPHVLFVERSMQLLRDGGRMALILPESVLHGKNQSYVRDFITEGNNLKWVIDLPGNTFAPYTTAKCVAFILEKGVAQQEKINMLVLDQVGHDHHGKELFKWDPVKQELTDEIWDDTLNYEQNSFQVDFSVCKEKDFYIPRYFRNDESVEDNDEFEYISVSRLIEENVLSFFKGHGSPMGTGTYKGKGEIPYIRTSDLCGWEIQKRPETAMPEHVYNSKVKDDKLLRKEDVLFVTRGGYDRIGSTAMLSHNDTKMIIVSETSIVRVEDLNNKYNIDPYYLIYLLSNKKSQGQLGNKIFIDTTMADIRDRWIDVKLPIHRSESKRIEIGKKVKSAIHNKWEAVDTIKSLTEE